MHKLIKFLKKHSLSEKLSNLPNASIYYEFFILTFLVFEITILGISFYLERHMRQTHIGLVEEELRSIAGMAAMQIDGDLLTQLRHPRQEKTIQYQRLQKILNRMMRANPKIDDIYLMCKSNRLGQLVFIMNAYLVGKDHIALGEPYEVVQAPDMLRGFSAPTVDHKFTTDKWGKMLSGYAPVKSRQGRVTGMLGIDFRANDIEAAYGKWLWYILWYGVLEMSIMFVVCYILSQKMVKRLNNIQYAVDLALKEKRGVTIRDKGNDEIQKLASRVNQLIQKTVVDQEQILMNSTTGLINALEARDGYTHGHSAKVAEIVGDIMHELHLKPKQRYAINFAAILHDIGKIGIPDMILNKPGKLTVAEYDIIKQHPVIGEKILERILWLDEIRDMVRHHHERYDGKGYPDRLAAEQIHFGARIIAVADSFQAMISDRPYRKGLPEETALEELRKNRGTQFDPVIVDVFLMICQTKKYY
jgi:putative nucleotidyltransferase with HDIG domain